MYIYIYIQQSTIMTFLLWPFAVKEINCVKANQQVLNILVQSRKIVLPLAQTRSPVSLLSLNFAI